MLVHARESAPNECCGLLIGRSGEITRTVRATNIDSSPTRYLIDPRDHLAAIHAARSEGRRVVGAYHSHPARPPVPSDSDLAEANWGSTFLYVIVSPAEAAGNQVRAYRIKAGRAEGVELVSAAEEPDERGR
jgi:proteasome lid subunit RPN8/RPN11